MVLKIGVLSISWLPHFGGAEKYAYNMVNELSKLGIDIVGITPSQKKAGKTNGDENLVVRLYDDTTGDITNNDVKSIFEWWNAHAKNHIIEEGYDIIIFNNFRHVHHYLKNIFMDLHYHRIKCGIIQHDIGLKIRKELVKNYHELNDWELSAQKVEESQHNIWDKIASLNNDLTTVEDMGFIFESPLYFNPDFIITNTEWTKRFLDIKNQIPKYNLHPIIEEPTSFTAKLSKVNITMINPMYHKGRSYMADLINDYDHKWTYRVLLGFSGSDKNKEFLSMIEDSWALKEGRVEILEYVEDIYSAYHATDIFVFPSRYEGYGMAAVEPMLIGKPVIVQDYPSIIEAVGDSAYTIKWGSSSKEWLEAVEELLYDDEEYVEKSLNRAKELEVRKHEELLGLIDFMEKLL